MKAVQKTHYPSEEKKAKKAKKKQQSERSFRKETKEDTDKGRGTNTSKNEIVTQKQIQNRNIRAMKSHKHTDSENTHNSSQNNSSLLRTTTKKLKTVLKRQNLKGNKSMGQEMSSNSNNKLINLKSSQIIQQRDN